MALSPFQSLSCDFCFVLFLNSSFTNFILPSSSSCNVPFIQYSRHISKQHKQTNINLYPFFRSSMMREIFSFSIPTHINQNGYSRFPFRISHLLMLFFFRGRHSLANQFWMVQSCFHLIEIIMKIVSNAFLLSWLQKLKIAKN